MSRSAPVVEATNDSTTHQLDLERWIEVATRTLIDEGVAGGSLDLLFVDADEIAGLNLTHLGRDEPTDVLSFPLDPPPGGEVEPGWGASAEGFDGPPPVHLGDVVVCPRVAADQAPEHCGDLDAELTLLIVHGVLHILGHDHAEPGERDRMIERERHHLARYGLSHPGPQA